MGFYVFFALAFWRFSALFSVSACVEFGTGWLRCQCCYASRAVIPSEAEGSAFRDRNGRFLH
jgi:hypothetical protein